MKKMRVLWAAFCLLLFYTAFSAAAEERLPLALEKAIKDAGFNRDGIGLYIHGVDATNPLVSFQANQAFNPASVIKLVTTAVSLGMLGAGYRWSTQVSYTGHLKHGNLIGDLYFRGNGDPFLTPERFWRLLNRIAIYGIRDIRGNIILDNSYFDPGFIDYAAFDKQPYRTYNVGPNAILVGFQATEFHFAVTNEGNGDQVRIIPFPASPVLRIVNKVKPVNGGCGSWQKRLSLETHTNGEVLQVTFGGRYARACDRKTLYRRVAGSDDHFQHFFLPLWRQLGGSFSGKIASGGIPDNATPVIEEQSISLGEAVRLINKFSNNVMIRQVLLTIGAHSFGLPGTTEKGIAAVKAWLVQRKLDGRVLQLDNGAGLSRETRTSAALLGRLLHYVYRQAYMPEFIASLPVSGQDGAMAHRFRDEPIMGHAHIKTGLLDFVQSMAGYVTTASGKRFVVVLLHNDPRAHTKAAERLQDQVIRWVYQL